MDDAQGMCFDQHVENLTRVVGRLLQRQLSLSMQSLGQLLAVEKLHHQVQVSLVGRL